MSCEVIVALDVPNGEEMIPVVDSIGESISFYKVGLELFIAEGPDVLSPLNAKGKKIFLDLKLHDIPRTVARAVTAAGRHHVDLLTIHASGGEAMLNAAAEAAAAFGEDRPKLLAITALTSLDQTDLKRIGITERTISEHAGSLAELATDAGIDGIVCSPLEAQTMRARLGADALIITPGVRPAGGDVGDQKRVATPEDAARAGATHLVIGRPIVQASSPSVAAAKIVYEVEQALKG